MRNIVITIAFSVLTVFSFGQETKEERKYGKMVYNLSDAMIKGGQAPVFSTPSDYELEYEDVTFKASDGVTLSGWLIKGGTDKIIIQSHYGVQSSRSGYTPEGKGSPKMWKENIEFLNQAKYLVDNGYSVLMYDFRNHGNSGEGTCSYVTWGPDEHKDVIAAVNFISEHPTYKNSDIGLLSICMGAAATTYAYGIENGLASNENIKAIIAVQPLVYPDFLDALGLPKGLDRKITDVNSERTGIDLMQKSFVPDAKKITVPTLLVQSSNDPYMNREMIETYFNNLQVEKEMLWLGDLKKKRAAGYDYLSKNPGEVLGFFKKYM